MGGVTQKMADASESAVDPEPRAATVAEFTGALVTLCQTQSIDPCQPDVEVYVFHIEARLQYRSAVNFDIEGSAETLIYKLTEN